MLRCERGLTLTELTVVGALAVIVMLGLTGFYLNSQRLWLDSSTKAMTQRDATLALDVLGRRMHEASAAIVSQSDPEHDTLELFRRDTCFAKIQWSASDQRLHFIDVVNSVDRGTLVDSRSSRFQLTTIGTNLVELTALELVSPSGDTVRVASRFALLSTP